MKKSKDLVYEFVQQQVYTNSTNLEGVSTKAVSDALNMQRSNVSALLNQLVSEGVLIKTNSRPVLYNLAGDVNEKHDFDTLIGSNGSLKNAIQLAKAAILYPKSSLNVLIQANQGSGTTFFVNKMVEFAKNRKVIAPDAPYIRLNCRTFSKEPLLLNEELFGTDNNYIGSCFDRAWSGILYIDYFDFLDARQQAKILDFLNNTIKIWKKERQLLKRNNLMVILSTTPTHELLVSQMVPVTIKLPELQKRSYQEQFELINQFFSNEAAHSMKTIVVPTEIIRALLLSEFTFNIKELKMDIISACASGYVRIVNDETQDIKINFQDFKPALKKNLLRAKENSLIFEELFGSADNIIYDKEMGYLKDYGKFDTDFYQEIKKQYQTLADSGINDNSITTVINKYVQNLSNKYHYYHVFDDNYNITQLAKIADKQVIEIVELWLKRCKKSLHRDFKSSVFYGLCLHINSLLTLTSYRQGATDDEITQIIRQYPAEYECSVQLSKVLNERFNLNLPTDEIILIMMFLIDSEEKKATGNPVLLYIMHGDQVASSLAKTTNLFTQTNNIYSYDMRLEISSNQAMIEIKELILKINQGQGVIIIYDMGSVKTIIETIGEEINCKLRLIYSPVTLVGIEVARKSSMETDVDYVYHTVSMGLNDLLHKEEKDYKLIITLCHTGEGGAEQLKRYIEQYSKLGMKVKALAISSRNELIKEVIALKKIYKIHSFVGTYDPNIFGIPFISIGSVFENTKENLDRLLMFEPITTQFFDYTEVYNYLEESFKYTSISKLKMILPDVIDEIGNLYPLNLDQSVGLFMHIACLIERLLEGKKIPSKEAKLTILDSFKQDATKLTKILKKIERNFKVIINDDELATIIMIIKKI